MNQFAQDVLTGLSRTPKRLPSKYFYDKIGSELFVKIMQSEEYYVTDAELDIFQHKTDALVAALNQSPDQAFQIIELGAGDGTKTIHLLRALLEQGYDFDYAPIDISIDALADQNLINNNFNGQPDIHVESIDLARKENEQYLQKRQQQN